MSKIKLPSRVYDAVHWFMNDLKARIVAESGRPNDIYHIGKILLQSLKDDPDFVMQIDGRTGDQETSGSALERSVRCAVALKNLGLQRGDVMVLMAPNHIDLAIPFYAALYLGIIVAAVDRTSGFQELRDTFAVNSPKIVFCQSEKTQDVQIALNDLEIDIQIVTFDKSDYLCSFPEFLEKYGENVNVDKYRTDDFDPDDTIALLIATSGTTGLPKAAAVTHKNLAITGPYLWSKFNNFPTPTKMAFIISPVQWLSALLNFILSPILRYTRLQSSLPVAQDHIYEIINKYKPTFTVMSPTLMTTLLKPGDRENCDFTCLEQIYVGGSAVPQALINEMKQVSPDTEVLDIYGASELASIGFYGECTPPGSCGKPVGCLQHRLIDVETQQDILEPNVSGELWVKGPGIFKEYYKNPAATEKVFAEDRWFKTGDIFYRDENWNYFFVERLKLLLNCMSHQISPVEIEGVIRQHPSVLDVAVTGIPDLECNELPVACVVPKPGYYVTAQEIKDLVKEKLGDSKQLRGGVIFLPELPLTASTKVHRRKINEIALTMDKE